MPGIDTASTFCPSGIASQFEGLLHSPLVVAVQVDKGRTVMLAVVVGWLVNV